MISQREPLIPQHPIWKILFWLLASTLLIGMPLLSRHYGVTWDEWMDSNNAMLALRNILSGGTNMDFMNFWHGYLYPQVFYTFVGTTFGLFFDSVWNIAHDGLHKDALIIPFFQHSHLINSLFGFSAIFFTALFAKKLAGWRLAFFTLLFMALSPRFLGNSMHNPKDIPFAATYIFSLYLMASFLENLPRLNLKNILLIALGIGLCMGCRLGGLILIAYLFFLTFVILWINRTKLTRKDWVGITFALIGLTMLSVGIGFIFWPYGRTHTPIETFQALMKITRFKFWNYGVLFDGKFFIASDLPWYYSAKWILISTPLFFPIGLVLWGFGSQIKNFIANQSVFLLAIAGFFPLLFIILRHSIVYDGWRHLTFIYPPLMILCVLGWDNWFQLNSARWKKMAVGLALVLFCAEPLMWMIRNPTYASVYFNPLVGGLKGAFTQYESDYWGSCMQESAEWLADYHLKNSADFPYALVAADGQTMQTYPFLKRKLGKNYYPFGHPKDFLTKSPYEYWGPGGPMSKDLMWNYAIHMSRGRSSKDLKYHWPPEGTIYTAGADSIPLCAVVKNDLFDARIKKELHKT